MKKMLLILWLLGIPFALLAQDGISISSNHEVLFGELGIVYKPAVNVELGYSHIEYDNEFSISLGYRSFQAKQDTFFFLSEGLDRIELGSVVYDNYRILSLSASFAKHFYVSKYAFLFGGVELGYYQTWFGYESDGALVNESFSSSDSQIHLSPKAGIGYKMSDNILFKVQSRVNFFASAGSADANSSNYNPNANGRIYSSISNGLSLTYFF